jgi:methenyltetrahydromethanopterin cyclohydrolase
MTMNRRALARVDSFLTDAAMRRVAVHTIGGARVVDCGIATAGGLEAGVLLARVCLADLGSVSLVPSPLSELPSLAVQVTCDQPLLACLGSQYAGWQIQAGKFFAMGSGPMRAKYAHEDLYREFPDLTEPAEAVVGVLETRKLPTEEVIAHLADKLGLTAERLTLLVAPTASLAGTLQVVARTLETALHKLHTLHFDLRSIVSGTGLAPLPPVAKDDLTGIGWTNDAVLYGGQATLWVRTDDALLEQVGPQVPAIASRDYGAPFAEIFRQAGGDFYKIDPMLFSPAQVTFHNLTSGRTHTFGRLSVEVLRRSFGG